MNENFEKLLNPPWLKSIQEFQNRAAVATLAFQESEAVRTLRNLNESAKVAASAFSQSEFMRSAHLMAESSNLASLAFRQSEAMASINEIAASGRFNALVLQESKAMNLLRTIAESARISALAFQQSETANQLESIVKTSHLASIALGQSEAFKQICQLHTLASFKALANLNNSPFSEISLVDFTAYIDPELIADKSLLEIDSQISEEVTNETDFNGLSDKTKSILLYLFHYYFLPILTNCLSTYLMITAGEARKELKSVSTPAEVKTFVRSSHSSFDRSVLKGFRLTIVDHLNLRTAPNMRSEVIITLPIGTLVEVIEKSHRSWLLVEVEIDGEIEQGWVSRRYTTYFK